MAWIERCTSDATVLFTDRTGGVSVAPYDSANVGFNTDDDPSSLAENRRIARERFKGPGRWVRSEQVHGSGIVYVGQGLDSGGEPHSVGPADGIVTTLRDSSLAIFTADCAPIALFTHRVVAGVHAGWRGLSSGVIERALETLRSVAGDVASEGSGDGGPKVSAVIGPCIHPCCYEFPQEQIEIIAKKFGSLVQGRTSAGLPSLDIPGTVRTVLKREGVWAIDDLAVCTSCNKDYFSHRRDGPVTGRQVMLVALLADGVAG